MISRKKLEAHLLRYFWMVSANSVETRILYLKGKYQLKKSYVFISCAFLNINIVINICLGLSKLEFSSEDESQLIKRVHHLGNITWGLLLSLVSVPFFATKHLKNMAFAVPPSIISCCNKIQSMLLLEWAIGFCFK